METAPGSVGTADVREETTIMFTLDTPAGELDF